MNKGTINLESKRLILKKIKGIIKKDRIKTKKKQRN